jgi:hypothetical protein
MEKTMKILAKFIIVRSTYNIGDHNCLRYVLESIHDLLLTVEVPEKQQIKTVSWQNKTVRHDYSIKCDKQLARYDTYMKALIHSPNDNALKCKLTNAMKFINDSLVWSKERVKNYHTKTKIPKKKYGIKCKDWWCKTLQEYMVEVRTTYNNWKRNNWSGDKKPYIDAKRLFKCRKRYNIKLERDKKLRKIDELFKLNHTAFWKKVKQAQRRKDKVDMSLDELVSNYDELFNNLFPASVNFNKINEELNEALNHPHEIIKLENQSIATIVRELPNGKSIGYHGISNEMVKYSYTETTTRIVDYYEIIFNKIIETGVVPDNFNISIIKPLVKDNKKPTNVLSNIRPVATSDVSPNVFEKALVIQIRITSPTHPKQFGFKKRASCSHAIFVMKQAIKYANTINKRIYLCALDASKAFDKVIRVVLWWKLAKKNVNPCLVKALMSYYAESKIIVNLDGVVSKLIPTTNGFKQGGPISPDLWNLYVDELIDDIDLNPAGIVFGNVKVDIVAYADDITLMSTTKVGLQSQIDICSTYGKRYGIKFNPDKSILMIFNLDVQRSNSEILADFWQQDVQMDGNPIIRVYSVRILGYVLSCDLKNTMHMEKRKICLNVVTAKLALLSFTSNHLHPKVKAQLFKSYIRPVITFGCENLSLTDIDNNIFKRLEGNSIKRMLKIPTRCHSTDLMDALDIEPTKNFCLRMKIKFVIRLASNVFTYQMLENMILHKDQSSFTTEIANHLSLNQDYDLIALLNACENFLQMSKTKKNSQKNHPVYNNEKLVLQIKRILDMTNRRLIPSFLFNIIKFETVLSVKKLLVMRETAVNLLTHNNFLCVFFMINFFLLMLKTSNFFTDDNNNNILIRDVD